MQKNKAYGAYTRSTPENDYDAVQAPYPRTQVDSDLPANNKAVRSSQQSKSTEYLYPKSSSSTKQPPQHEP